MIDTQHESELPSHPHDILFAGGGTGGHLYPGIAIAEQIRNLAPEVSFHFLCSRKPLDTHILNEEGYPYRPISAQPLLLRPFPSAPYRFLRGWLRAEREAGQVFDDLLRNADNPRRLHIVLMGGYIAPPVACAAARRHIPITLVNLDVVPGKANRLATRWASDIVSAVHCDKPASIASAPVLGMPVRRRAIATGSQSECRTRLGLRPDLYTLLITGASQGAGTFNRLLIDMTADSRYRRVFQGWQVLHLCGAEREAGLYEHYETQGINAVVLPYCNEMGDAWGSADLAISRAGASSVAEAEINAVPTVFLPYPWHHDDHQRKNAERLVEQGGGWVVRDAVDAGENLEVVGSMVAGIMGDEKGLREARSVFGGGKGRNAGVEIALRVLGIRP